MVEVKVGVDGEEDEEDEDKLLEEGGKAQTKWPAASEALMANETKSHMHRPALLQITQPLLDSVRVTGNRMTLMAFTVSDQTKCNFGTFTTTKGWVRQR